MEQILLGLPHQTGNSGGGGVGGSEEDHRLQWEKKTCENEPRPAL